MNSNKKTQLGTMNMKNKVTVKKLNPYKQEQC
jgi:hypothetical protein